MFSSEELLSNCFFSPLFCINLTAKFDTNYAGSHEINQNLDSLESSWTLLGIFNNNS